MNRGAAGDLGLDLGTIASTVRGLVAGEVVSQFEDPDGDSYDVRLRVDPSHRTYSADLLNLDLPGQFGRTLVPLRQVARLDTGAAPSKINRWDLMREIRVGANTQGRSLGEVVNDIKARAANLNLPPGYSITFTGEAEDMVESFGYVMQSLLLAVILIYAILASQFRSFLQPFAIMLSLPLSLIGVAAMLYLVHDTHEHDVADRSDPADGAGDQERDSGDRLHESAAARRAQPARCPDHGGAHPAAPDHHDHAWQ